MQYGHSRARWTVSRSVLGHRNAYKLYVKSSPRKQSADSDPGDALA